MSLVHQLHPYTCLRHLVTCHKFPHSNSLNSLATLNPYLTTAETNRDPSNLTTSIPALHHVNISTKVHLTPSLTHVLPHHKTNRICPPKEREKSLLLQISHTAAISGSGIVDPISHLPC
ncbi:hypothetical protein COCSADRAFT_41163 [Bipolaris sorokiniana ND90Pr]|nr:uncharacterized protein COCSADRAFT_41163 [Bipolaris sorokiniana ND90Pr]EMD59299.1 hypothetical protein COCSADRAFT_41163 [Bipolaris sorokiniana ND90Pr]